jgi:hypothetical protein
VRKKKDLEWKKAKKKDNKQTEISHKPTPTQMVSNMHRDTLRFKSQ